MKVVYNWLKDFVDVTATPQELASRLALSGTNIGGVENGAHGAVIEAEVSSNRPDCLGHHGIAREAAAEARFAQAGGRPGQSRRRRKSRDSIPGTLWPLHRPRHAKREDPALSEMAERPPRSFRRRQHQQRRRRFELRDARARPPAAHF